MVQDFNPIRSEKKNCGFCRGEGKKHNGGVGVDRGGQMGVAAKVVGGGESPKEEIGRAHV